MTAQNSGMRVAIALVWVLAPISGVANAAAPCFKVFDSTLFLDRPDLASYGMERTTLIGVKHWLAKSAAADAIPKEETIRLWIAQQKPAHSLFVLDLEHWPQTGTLEEVHKSVQGYLTVLERVRRSGEVGAIGYYGLPPIRNYWATQGARSAKYLSWQAENDLWQPLANAVDVLFPSVYTFYDDQVGWVRYAKENLAEARRLAKGKPVYAFIWPQYHDSNESLGLRFIAGDFWRLQLQTIAQYADGAVIWGGGGKRWDERAPWWQATREFLRTDPHICRAPEPPRDLVVDPG